MIWGCMSNGRTPAMIRTGYDLVKPSPPLTCDPALRPALSPGRNPSEDSDVFGEWLGHLAAGRIEIR